MFYLLSNCDLFGIVSYCIERYDFVWAEPFQDIVCIDVNNKQLV